MYIGNVFYIFETTEGIGTLNISSKIIGIQVNLTTTQLHYNKKYLGFETAVSICVQLVATGCFYIGT